MNIRDLPVYSKHFGANEPEDHARISVEYAISVLDELKESFNQLARSSMLTQQKIQELKEQLI